MKHHITDETKAAVVATTTELLKQGVSKNSAYKQAAGKHDVSESSARTWYQERVVGSTVKRVRRRTPVADDTKLFPQTEREFLLHQSGFESGHASGFAAGLQLGKRL